jgi:class 3 adenylate cyclase
LGAEVDTAGDGFLTTFDGPARAIRCLRAFQREAAPLGLRLLQCERVIAASRAALGEAAFDEASKEGQAMTLERAIEYTLASGRPSGTV